MMITDIDGTDAFVATLPAVVTTVYTDRAERINRGVWITYDSTVFGPCMPRAAVVDEVRVGYDDDGTYSAFITTRCGGDSVDFLIVPANATIAVIHAAWQQA